MQVKQQSSTKIILDNHRTTREPICSYQDDTMGCYDRIIRNHAMLNNRKHGIPENVCKMHCNAHDNVIYKNQIKNKVSELIYTSAKELILHGVGQGAGNGGSHWTLIIVPMMQIVDKEAPGCTIQIPNNGNKWEIKIVGFVDDKKHYVNNLSRKTKETLEQAMQRSIRI